MRKLRSSALLFVLAAACLPQSGTTLVTPEIRRVGDKLACKCGVCNNTVATCQMLECHYSFPARAKIAEMQKTGLGDQEIVDSFVKERGIAALAAPPMQGFNVLGYVMPFVVIGIGLGAITLWMKRFRKPRSVAAPVDPQAYERYRKRVEQETADLD